jgi:hypothetical protein
MSPQKSSWHRSPLWMSVPIVLLIYGTFGWIGSSSWQLQPSRFIILCLTSILVDLIAVSPYRLLEILFAGIFGANIRSLLIVMACATLLVVMFTWLPIVYYATLMLAASLLMTMDLATKGWGRWQSFIGLTVCQIIGLGIGFGSNIDWVRTMKYLQSLPHS